VAAFKEEMLQDINAFHAQLDKLLTQIMLTYASNNQLVVYTPSDLLEIPLTVEDAKHVTSLNRFLINQKPDVLLDQRPFAIALREDPKMDIPVSNAQLVRSET